MCAALAPNARAGPGHGPALRGRQVRARRDWRGDQPRAAHVNLVKPKSSYFQTSAIRIHFLEWNPKGRKTVILLHGLYDSADTWRSVAPLLARDYRVIAVDRRGAGLTDKPLDGYDVPTLANDVVSLIDGLKLERVHLVGHSAGAATALTVAATATLRIESVSLLDGGFWPRRASDPVEAKGPRCKPRDRNCLRLDLIERENRSYDPETLYSAVQVPVLFLVASPPEPEASKFKREIEEAHSSVRATAKDKVRFGKFEVVNDSGHWIQRDQPKVLVEKLQEFFVASKSRK